MTGFWFLLMPKNNTPDVFLAFSNSRPCKMNSEKNFNLVKQRYVGAYLVLESSESASLDIVLQCFLFFLCFPQHTNHSFRLENLQLHTDLHLCVMKMYGAWHVQD